MGTLEYLTEYGDHEAMLPEEIVVADVRAVAVRHTNSIAVLKGGLLFVVLHCADEHLPLTQSDCRTAPLRFQRRRDTWPRMMPWPRGARHLLGL